MKRKKIIIGIYCAAAAIASVSCSGSSDENEIQHIELADTTAVDTVVEIASIDYSVPTPNELFEIIKLQGGEQKLELVNPIENAENYVDVKSKSINFGVYSADIAYLSCFGIGVDFLKYFKKIEELGEELGIAGAFDEEMMDRIENNEGDSDSLFAISNDTYYDSYLYLEENEKGKELSLIMAGGYIESLYIITNLVEQYADNDPVVKKIGDQKVVLENLIDFIFEYSDDEDVNNIILDLTDLADVFESNMDLKESETNVANDQDGTLLISGGGSYHMTAAAFDAIKAKANELRVKYTN
ncbi:hypothetical protein [Crocinitomix algicola]|uniref:hypothetical protein n=1 Tax=Crocinitomix algicola TaxID=1740263 RepID=UPI0008724C9A|nr:hypothetical protein [Crocinitomix algicola]